MRLRKNFAQVRLDEGKRCMQCDGPITEKHEHHKCKCWQHVRMGVDREGGLVSRSLRANAAASRVRISRDRAVRCENLMKKQRPQLSRGL